MQFVHDTRVSATTLWQEFAFEHATVPVISKRHHISKSTVHRRLDDYALDEPHPVPRIMVAVIDATKVGWVWTLVVRDPHAKENVYAREVSSETTFAYQEAHARLTRQGFSFSAIVSDGRFVAVPWLFPGIPVQMCHFHQEQIVIRYLTQNPKLEAGVELLALIKTLPRADGSSFTDSFMLWCSKWHSFLQEKTIEPETNQGHWTHRRLRQARDSISTHLPYLFTYQKYPELKIPNTTNSLDGVFKKAKIAIGVHAGLTHARQIKLVMSLLSARE